MAVPWSAGHPAAGSRRAHAAGARAAAPASSQCPEKSQSPGVTGARAGKQDASSSTVPLTPLKAPAFRSACFSLLLVSRAIVLQPWVLAWVAVRVLK